jgi:Lrp/AsnC family leucine-responsive transcriptional regulator
MDLSSMTKNTNGVRPEATPGARLDNVDRKLLGLLSEDATRSYADLGNLVHLSAPAVHERVKRLKQDKVIKATVASLDGTKLGRPLLAFVQVDTKLWAQSHQLLELSDFPDVEEMHTVTGETAVLLKIRTRDAQSLENLLVRIHGIESIEGTRSHIVLSTYLERGPSPQLD